MMQDASLLFRAAGATQRGDIQGLRAVAVLAVIAFHVNNTWLPGGFLGVDVFLVISGYLITGIVLRQRYQQQFSFIKFYSARIKRIVPAYMALIAVVSIFMAVLLIPRDFGTFHESLVSALYFNSNNFFARYGDYFAPASHELPLLHTWSLAIEMQFYLLLPAVLIFLPLRAIAGSLGLIAFTCLVYTVIQVDKGANQQMYFSLVARIPEFLIGGLVAAVGLGASWSFRLRNCFAFIGLLLVLGSFVFISEKDPFPGLLAMPACIGVALMIAAREGVCNQVLANKWFVFIGALSYSLYLWHWPVLAGIRYYYEVYLLSTSNIVWALGATFALAYVSYRFIEMPFRKTQFNKARTLRVGVLISSLGGLLIVSLPLNSRIVEPLPPALTRYAPLEEICHGKVLDSCAQGDLNGSKTILLMGDSHAAQLNYFADVVGKELDIKFEVVTASSCVPIEGFDVERLPRFAQEPCRKQINEIRTRLHSVDGVILAGKWDFHISSIEFRNSISDFLSLIELSGKPVMVLAQIPNLKGNVERTIRFNSLGMNKELVLDHAWYNANEDMRRLLNSHPGIVFQDLAALKLFDNISKEDRKDIIYFDNNHLNERGAKEYGHMAIPHIRNWIMQ